MATSTEIHAAQVRWAYLLRGMLPRIDRAKPWLIRKSWWIPGAHAKHGQVAWLQRYWPSLHAKLAAMTYDARSYA